MDLLKKGVELARGGVAVALATAIRTSGSTPRHVGAKMLVAADGSVFGTIGGGRVEKEVIAVAREVARGGLARRVQHDLVRDLGMSCGGSMEFYVEPVAPSEVALARIVELLASRRPVLITTPLDGSPKVVAELSDPAEQIARCEDEHFVEALLPPDRVILFGCGHVAMAIGPLAIQVGFEAVMCDDTDREHVAPAWAHRFVGSFDVRDIERDVGPLGAGDYAIIVTRDHPTDQKLLEQLLPIEALSYLGMIGSRRKIANFRRRLEAKGIATDERWARLHAPIGMEIGAETPEEIAVSIIAELIAARRKE